jgi:hypothetical protein
MHRNKVDKLRGQGSNKYSKVIYLELQQPITDHSYRRFGLTKEYTSSINFNSLTDLACLWTSGDQITGDLPWLK